MKDKTGKGEKIQEDRRMLIVGLSENRIPQNPVIDLHFLCEIVIVGYPQVIFISPL